MGWRSETEFATYWRFERAIDELINSSLQITADIVRFQGAYKQSNVNSELPKGFDFKELEKVAGLYNVCEIYVGPNNNFRAILMLPHSRIQGRLLAYWVFLFKKQRGRDHQMVERAKAIARECWNSIERG